MMMAGKDFMRSKTQHFLYFDAKIYINCKKTIKITNIL